MVWHNRTRTESSCLPCGEYDARFIKIERTTSKKGNQMAAVQLEIEHEGRKRIVRDWIVQGFPKSMAKIPAIAAGLGMEAELAAGEFRLGEQVGSRIRIAVGRRNDPKYGWSNTVEEYKATGLGLGADIPPAEEPSGPVYENNADYPF